MSEAYMQTLSLKADSEDITNSLNSFFAERQAATERQNEALNAYDQELLDIGEYQEEDG
jgi:hypothetical protein